MKTQNTKQYPAYVDRTGNVQVPFRALVRADKQRNHEPAPARPSYNEFRASKVPQNHIQAWELHEAEMEQQRAAEEREMLRTKFWNLKGAKVHKAELAAGHDATLPERRRIRDGLERDGRNRRERAHRQEIGRFYAARAESLGLPFASIEDAFVRVHQALHDEHEIEARMQQFFQELRSTREEKAEYQEALYNNARRLAPALPEVEHGRFVAGVVPFVAAIVVDHVDAGDVTAETAARFVQQLVGFPEEAKKRSERTQELVDRAAALRESEQYWEHDERVERPRGSRRGAGKATRLRARSVASLRETLARLNVKPQPRFHEVKLISDIHAELQRRGEELEITSLINS